MGIKFLIFVLALLFSYFCISLCPRPVAWPLGSEIVKPGFPICDIEKIKQRMFYHGTLIVQRDLETGEWFFYRKDEKCKLK